MTNTTKALSINELELSDGRVIPAGEKFECPTKDYEDFLEMGAVKPARGHTESTQVPAATAPAKASGTT